MRPRLQPEDLRRDIAALGGREQRAGNYGIGLGDTAIEVVATLLAQGLRRAPDDPGDIVLTDADPRQVTHLLAHRLIDDKRPSRHRRPLEPDPDWRHARRRIDPRLDGSPCDR